METLKPNTKRAKTAILFIWIVLALEVVSIVSGYFQYELLQNAANGGEITTEAASANDLREQIIGVIYSIVYIVSAITFIQWFRRAYFNLHQRVHGLSFTEGWAAGSWFVPILNLFRPFQIMKELYHEARELVADRELSIYENFTAGALGIWWTLWVINNILGQVVFRYALNAQSIDELTNSTIAGMAGNFIGIPLAIITVKLIKDYAAVEPLLAEVNNEDDATTPGGDYLSR
jgi:hypothetical protein